MQVQPRSTGEIKPTGGNSEPMEKGSQWVNVPNSLLHRAHIEVYSSPSARSDNQLDNAAFIGVPFLLVSLSQLLCYYFLKPLSK